MSLINQMLRDLENRKLNPNTAPALQHNIKASKHVTSKMPLLLWSLLAITVSCGIFWAFKFPKTQTEVTTIVTGENNNPPPIPLVPFEKALSAPNDVSTKRLKIEPKTAEIKTTPSIVTVTASTAAAIPKTPIEAPAAQKIIPKEPVKKLSDTSNPAIVKQITAKEQAEALYRQAENNSESALILFTLEKILQLDPRHLKARLLMIKTLHNQGQIEKTATFLDQSLALFPDNLQFINTRAQLYLQQKDPKGALTTLEHIDVNNSNNETSLSLLAASYQQLQSSNNAAKIYQKLVVMNPEKAENWLGLALAEENLGNLKLARESYQEALNKNTLKESITSYIKQKLFNLR